MEFGEDSIKKITRDVLEAATGGFVAQADAGFEDGKLICAYFYMFPDIKYVVEAFGPVLGSLHCTV